MSKNKIEIKDWLKKYNFSSDVNVEKVTSDILADMEKGLKGEKAYQIMAKTWMCPKMERPKNESAIVIDAGGTNFRSCLVSFDGDGNPKISDMEKTFMPGSDKEYSKKEFFDKIAENLDHLKGKSSKIGFCFSYPMVITENGDGICGKLSKEIKAPEIEGCLVGEELKNALLRRGWKNIESIKLLNDTVSALFSGVTIGKEYSSYIGFILGTGMNGAYIESSLPDGKMAIDCETGFFSNIEISDFDKAYNQKSAHPGVSLIEKCCSGGYLPFVVKEIFDAAEKDGILDKAPDAVLSMKKLSEIDEPVKKEIFSEVVRRASLFASAIVSADAIKSGKGKNGEKPVCIVCNGTTFWKTPDMKKIFEESLNSMLSSRGISFEIVSVDDDITLGTALAVL